MPANKRAGGKDVAVVRDYEDVRDFPYSPSLGALHRCCWPKRWLFDEQGRLRFGVRSQGRDSDCVGQSLAALVDIQTRLLVGEPDDPEFPDDRDRVSANMLYRMAQYHEAADEIGAAAARAARSNPDEGVRSLRSAIKAFYHHGACLATSGTAKPGALWSDDEAGRSLSWLSAAQATDAEQRFLGAYYRLKPLLNHYHAALRDSDTILVSAAIHDGWSAEGMASEAAAGRVAPGTIPLRPAGNGDFHAFLIIGYTGDGFLVLNSHGEDWGGVPRPAEWGEAKVTLKGVGLWTYADWAENVADGWVMRLGVPGRDAFRYSTEEHGYRKRLYGRIAAPSSSSMPQHELRGRFINLEDGLLVKSGTYATPPAACAEFRDTMRDLVARATGGIVLRFPGFLEPMGDGFRRAAHLKKEYAGLGLETANFFWSANFAEQILELVSSAVNGARKITGGDDTDRVDALVEHALSSIGRACWRELVLSAANAVYHRGRAAERPGATIGCLERRPGKLGLAVAEIAGYCREQQRPLHVVTEGAGALVLRDLIDLAEDSGVSERELLGGLTSVTMLFPTIPVDETGSLLAHMEKLNRDVGGPAAAIVLPTRELEKTLNCRGYGKSVNQLVSHAFVDRHDGPPRPLLGMSRETIRDYLPASLDADLARRDEDLPADRRMKPARREKIVRSKAAEWRKRIRALAVEVGPEDLDQPAAVARGTRLITTDEGISKIVRERLRSHSQGRPRGGEDRVQGPSGANGEGGSHGGRVGSLLHHDRGTGPVPAGDRDQLGERPEA